MELIGCKFDKVDYIVHISDIHIRLLKRHKEYKKVFNNLYRDLRKFRKHHRNTIICLLGDVFHSKTDLSPEAVNLCSNFLFSLSEIFPTILIAGNHDANLANRNRLDSLFPIVRTLDHRNLHYLRRSGEYRLANISFGVMSIFDSSSKYPSPEEMSGDIKIGLYHGPVNNSIMDTGFKIRNSISIDLFSGYDIVLLGDIHKQQFVDSEQKIGYSSSLIQQNFGESVRGHGFLIWNLDEKSSEFYEVENEYGYYTLELDGENFLLDVEDIPPKSRIKLITKNMTHTDIKKSMVLLRNKYPRIEEITVSQFGSYFKNKISDDSEEINVGDLNDVKYQNDLIIDYLLRNFKISSDEIEKVRRVNEELNLKLSDSDIIRNIVWKPQRFTFSNMFSFGENNVVDFSKMRGIVGVFAPNMSGKTSLLDSFTFCCYDKSSRAWKAVNVLNFKRNNFACRLEFTINNILYVIERRAKKNIKGDVKVDVDFFYYRDGKKYSLNGGERRSTNRFIREYIGSYDDFILTAVSMQREQRSIIDMRQSDRKDLLAQFLDVKIFDNLYDLASVEIKETMTLLKEFQKRNYDKELTVIDTELRRKEKQYDRFLKNKKELEKQRKRLNDGIIGLTKKLTEVGVLNDNIEELTDLVSNIKKEHTELLKNQKRYLSEIKDSRNIFQSLSDIPTKYEKYCRITEEQNKIKHEIDKLKIEVSNKLKKLSTLENLEYDPECSYCMNNPFVIDALKTKKEINEDKILAEDLVGKLSHVNNQLSDMEYIVSEYNKYNQLNLKLVRLNDDYNLNKNKLYELDIEFEKVKTEIKQYHKNKKTIENNKRIQTKIDEKKVLLNKVNMKIFEAEKDILELYGQIEVLREDQKTIIESIKKVSELEEKYNIYKYYIETVKRDGIPYELISKVTPVIELEANSILSQIVDFGITITIDGKNININIVRDDYSMWPVELSSGFERFIIGIALRVALLNVSSLPRPNFLAIDEGFGTLDAENLSNLYLLFQYLHERFDFVLVISHLDIMRDMVDSIVEIKKQRGYSRIRFE